MTTGHRHRTIRVKQQSVIRRLLTKPLLHTYSDARAERSRYVWGPCYQHGYRADGTTYCWTLSALGVLHALTGLTLEVKA